MSDLSRLIANLCAGLDTDDSLTVPTEEEAGGNGQVLDLSSFSHTSRISYTDDQVSQKSDRAPIGNQAFAPVVSRASSSCVGGVGTAGSVGTGVKTLAGSTSPSFPQNPERVGSVGTERANLRATFLDLNAAAPQRSDWWIGPAMAEFEALAPPAGSPLPITPADVRAGVARELRHLVGLGVTGSEAERRAVEITTGKIRNCAGLAERQANGGRCHHCGEALDDLRPVVAVLQAGGHLWVHGGECHDALSRRRAALVERIMAAAGCGAEATGAAA